MDDKLSEKSFSEYVRRMDELISDSEIELRVKKLKPGGRWDLNTRNPLPHPGYTIITPPFFEEDIERNRQTYGTLVNVQNELLKCIGTSSYVPAPPNSFHMTVADLVSTERYEAKVVKSQKEGTLRNEVRRVFSNLSHLQADRAPEMLVKGLTLFPIVVVAIVSTKDGEGYRKLANFRDAIYADPKLKQMGVDRKFSFTGHVTLAYIEHQPSEDELDCLAKTLKTLNRDRFGHGLPLTGARAELRKFNDMSCFYREYDWPVFRFK